MIKKIFEDKEVFSEYGLKNCLGRVARIDRGKSSMKTRFAKDYTVLNKEEEGTESRLG